MPNFLSPIFTPQSFSLHLVTCLSTFFLSQDVASLMASLSIPSVRLFCQLIHLATYDALRALFLLPVISIPLLTLTQ